MDIAAAMNTICSKYEWDIILKEKQTDVINHVLKKENVIGVLPTGYGKSLTYMLPPLLLDMVT